MPQMAPINWLFLFIMFIMIYIVFNSFNYFSFKYPVKSYQFKTKKSKINWKW
uniref:ATP synthase complex subunit 8 n=1 Tax=Sphaeridium bipustulatum TaxID=290649 RepID=A0A0S2M8B3_9COLE|nr:ATP synthase F0 subunit 8 [Sphaeridium bipustulatum]ALO70944.1 ATP synthase F0 subunit 8 [Sphaeridium bipustulatum]